MQRSGNFEGFPLNTRMSRWKLGAKVRMSVGYNPKMHHLQVGYRPFTNHLLTNFQRNIQVPEPHFMDMTKIITHQRPAHHSMMLITYVARNISQTPLKPKHERKLSIYKL